MRILLISPKGFMSTNSKLTEFLNASDIVLPYVEMFSGLTIGLLTVAALTPEDIEIDLIDENVSDIDFKQYYDAVAITAMTPQIERAYQIAKAFRNDKTKVIIGGIHATLLPQEVKRNCDSVVIGEAELLWNDVVNDLKKGKLKEFYKVDKLCDLSKSPVPRYDLLNPDLHKVVWVNTTRGCPYSCSFCASSNIFGNKYRYKKIDNILKEIKLIKNVWRGRKPGLISFADDNLFVNKKWAKVLLDKIRSLNIRWFAQTDISIADDDELLSRLYKSGCATLFIGFESVNERSIESINSPIKKKYYDRYADAIKRIQDHGIGVTGAFILGFDEDDISIFDRLIRFIKNTNMFAYQITLLTPLPGTEIYNDMVQQNRLLPLDWSHYSMSEVVFKPKRMSVDELNDGFVRVYEEIYDRGFQIEKAKYFLNVYKKLNKERVTNDIIC